jgi:ribulose-phosphate 3-epimerase
MISVHIEVLRHVNRTIAYIKSFGVQAGIVLNPGTPVVMLEQIAGDVDYVLVMSVNPGFGGQTFIPRSEAKVRAVRGMLDAAGSGAAVEIDGGIDLSNVARVVAAGADTIVAGSAVFHTADPASATRALKAAALAGVRGKADASPARA